MTSAMLAVLVARLWAQGAPQPAVSVLTGETLVCAAYTAAEIRSGGRHVFLCASSFSGEIEGALLRRNGVPVCPIGLSCAR